MKLQLIDSKARIERPQHFDTSRVVKSDMLREHIEQTCEREGTFKQLSKVVWPETLEKIARDLVALHRPFAIDYRARFGMEQIDDRTMGKQGSPLAVQPNKPSHYTCRNCGSHALFIQYGKYGYYFKCQTCGGNTPIKISCGIDGHHERIRKEKHRFFRECEQCKSSALFFENPS